MNNRDNRNQLVVAFVFLNVIIGVTCVTKCATLYTSVSFQGTAYSLIDETKQPYLRHMNYVPKSIHLTPGCSLTIFDIYGNRENLDKDKDNLGWSSHRVLDAACCHCGGCTSASSKLGGICARLYEHPNCDGCSGFRLDLKDGDSAKNFGILNNRMTSVAVRPGCIMSVFSEPEFGGWRFNFTDSNNMLGDNWRNQISSAKCGCNQKFEDTPPFQPPVVTTTMRPPMTLPTVPSWSRPPMTLPTVPSLSRPPMTLPTVPTTTRPHMTLPTVPTTTRRIITLPTVPTSKPTLPTIPTKPAMTLPTVSTTRAPITLPTIATTTESSYEPDDPEDLEDLEDFDWFGETSSNEITKSTTTTVKPIVFSEEGDKVEDLDLDLEEEDEEEDDDEEEKEKEEEEEEEEEDSWW